MAGFISGMYTHISERRCRCFSSISLGLHLSLIRSSEHQFTWDSWDGRDVWNEILMKWRPFGESFTPSCFCATANVEGHQVPLRPRSTLSDIWVVLQNVPKHVTPVHNMPLFTEKHFVVCVCLCVCTGGGCFWWIVQYSIQLVIHTWLHISVF